MKDGQGKIPGGTGTHVVVYEVAGDPETQTIRVKRMDAFSSIAFELQLHQAVQLSLGLAKKAQEMNQTALHRDLRNFTPEGDSN